MNILKKLFGKDSSADLQTAKQGTAYQQLIDAVKLNPDSVDFTQLRLAYAASTNYDPYNVKDNLTLKIKEFAEALQQENSERIIAASEQVLAIAPLYVWAHVQANYHYGQVGNTERVAYYQKFVKHWWDSLSQSGDGRSHLTAFIVVNLNEEFTALNLLQAQQQQQRLEEQTGHFFDVWTVRNPKTGERAEIYFNIDLVVKGVQEGRAQLPSKTDIQLAAEYRRQPPQ